MWECEFKTLFLHLSVRACVYACVCVFIVSLLLHLKDERQHSPAASQNLIKTFHLPRIMMHPLSKRMLFLVCFWAGL